MADITVTIKRTDSGQLIVGAIANNSSGLKDSAWVRVTNPKSMRYVESPEFSISMQYSEISFALSDISVTDDKYYIKAAESIVIGFYRLTFYVEYIEFDNVEYNIDGAITLTEQSGTLMFNTVDFANGEGYIIYRNGVKIADVK